MGAVFMPGRFRIKVVYFLDNFLPQINGVVNSAIHHIQEMDALGHRQLVVVPCPSRTYLKEEHINEEDFVQRCEQLLGDVKVVLVKSFFFPFYHDLRLTATRSKRIIDLVRDFDPDIIHFYTQLTLGLMAVHTAKVLGTSLVGSFHTFFAEPEYTKNIWFLRITGLYRNSILIKLLWWYNNRFFYAACDRVVTVCEYSKSVLVSKGLEGDCVSVIPNGIPIPERDGITAGRAMGKKQGRYILYVGRISWEKSLDVLLKAMKIIRHTIDDVQLLIVGDGPHREELFKLAEQENLLKTVKFLGPILNEELLDSDIYLKADLFVTASKSEAQPISILEAMSFGLPVVGVDSRGVPELLRFGNGIVVPPDSPERFADAVGTLLEDPCFRRSMSQSAIKAIKQFSKYNSCLKMIAVYKELAMEKLSPEYSQKS
jgi:1,2-diacylglycerol 3-alpha-glucosyltransferase